MFKKIFKFLRFVKYYLQDSDNIVLHLIEDKARETLKDCNSLEVSETEQIEDLIFHIKTYYEIPNTVKELKYPDVEIFDINKLMEGEFSDIRATDKFISYLMEVETQRAVERDFIFEHTKILPFGFRL